MEKALKSSSFLAASKNYVLLSAVLFWCGLIIVSGLYVTIPLFSSIASAFHISLNQASWSGSMYSFCYAIGFLLFGSFGDRFGNKRMILICLGLLAIISPLIGFIHQFQVLLVLRSLQGFVAATFVPAALSYVVKVFPVDKRVTTIGIVSFGLLTAGVLGQLFSSLVNQSFSWEYCFYWIGIIYFFTFVLCLFAIPKEPNSDKKISLFPSLQDFRKVSTDKKLVLCYVIAVSVLLSFVGMYTTLGGYLVQLSKDINDQTLLVIRAIGIVGMITSLYVGRMVARFGAFVVLRGGLTLAVIGLVLLGVFTNIPFLVIMSVVFVGGISVLIPNLIGIVNQLGGELRSTAISVYTFILFLGATIAPSLVINLVPVVGYAFTFEILALFLGLALVTSLFLKESK
ncbi:MFS transporter [Shimazuella sp. AN120528]|uniref:MFS transporter n=1 Tax=Shimazuella soli TaxID=1892854 RepID=UPI001F110493|nr:MFS transporter [Shimazuella soli]MCH5584447.1 MFS transporter [Shimazuella soli]